MIIDAAPKEIPSCGSYSKAEGPGILGAGALITVTFPIEKSASLFGRRVLSMPMRTAALATNPR